MKIPKQPLPNGEKRYREFCLVPRISILRNYMKNVDVALRDVKSKYDIKEAHVWFICFYYDHEFFTRKHIMDTTGRTYHQMDNLIKEINRNGLITKVYTKDDMIENLSEGLFYKEMRHKYRIRYGLTPKARRIVEEFYDKVECKKATEDITPRLPIRVQPLS
jgi:hypothetical protein